MPKQRPPFDTQRYESLKAQGLSQRAIAEQMGMPEATLRNNLKVMAQVIAESLSMGDQGVPDRDSIEVHQGIPKGDLAGPPEDDDGGLPLYVHPGIPDDGEESPVGGADIAEVHQGIPALPLTGIQEGDQGPPGTTLSPQLAESLTTAWPDMVQMLAWWRDRQRQRQEPPEKLERATYHIARRWIDAVRREADLTGESYAAVVHRAFRQYFERKSI